MSEVKTDLNSFESKLDLNNLNKSNWKTYRFDEIAKNISERVDPNNTDLKVYIGLEHIDSESLHIKRHGTPDDVNGQKLKFYKGDIIFGRRRAYQRKAGIATWDGFCSAHALVLRANPDVIDPELFPFFLHSDLFMNRAIDISVGSLSPTINWGTLKQQEFLIPPKEQQKNLVDLLLSSDSTIQSRKSVAESLNLLFSTERKYLIESGVSKAGVSQRLRFGNVFDGWKVRKLSSFCDFIGGNAFKSPRFEDVGTHQVLRIGNLTERGFDFTKSPVFIDDLASSEEKYLIPKGAVVVSLTGTNGKRDYGFPSLMVEDNKYLLNQRLVMLLVDNTVMLPEFLFLLSKMELFQGRFFLNATGTANQANVSVTDLADIDLPVPSIAEQEYILKRTNSISESYGMANDSIVQSELLKCTLLNKVF